MPAAARVTRVPPGHPEGYLEGFANIYTEIATAIRAARSKKKLDPAVMFPTVEDGVSGIAFIEAAVKSSAKDGKWVKVCISRVAPRIILPPPIGGGLG